MKPKASLNLKFLVFFIAAMAFFGGRTVMSAQIIKITWEWPAGRQLETKLLINIDKISKASTGFFGIRASPSMADAIPDATEVVATVISGQEDLVGKIISMRIPGVEAKKLKVGEPAAIALVDNNISICVSAAPPNKHELENWFSTWNCN